MNRPVITDFSEARLGLGPHRDDIMPDVYRAPEVIFDAPWDEKVDIWNLGVLLWTLLEGQNLFYGRDLEGQLNNYHHLAEMVALLGPPPANVVAAGELGLKYFEADGEYASKPRNLNGGALIGL
jgi:serine/threonine protein kinase